MPFFAHTEEDIPHIQSDLLDNASAAEEQAHEKEMVEEQFQQEEQDEPESNGATVVALNESKDAGEDADDDRDDEDIPASEEAPLGDNDADEVAPTPIATKKRGKSSQSKTPPSAKNAATAANGGRKRKALESGIDADTEVTPAKKGGRPARGTTAPGARLAAKAANKPTRGRPKVTASATSTKPSRGRPKGTAVTALSVSHTAAKAKGNRGRPKKNVDEAQGDEWEVEKIVDSGIDADTSEHRYLVKWKGYSAADNTWEPKRNLSHCMGLVRKFDVQHKSRANGGGEDVEEPHEPKKRGRKPKMKV